MILLFVFSFENFKTEYRPLVKTLEDKNFSVNSLKDLSSIKDTISSIEYTVNDSVYEKYKFIDAYGYIQKLMDKNEENNFEVVKDKNGYLHYTFFAYQPNPVYTLVKRTKAFKEGLKDKKTKLIYLMPPDKYIKGHTKFSKGLPYNYSNETADAFLKLLKENNVDSIDLRENLNKSEVPYNKLFFKTDHHWSTETAFWGFEQVVNALKKNYNLNIDQDGFYTNKENYNFIKYKDSYIGSMGRKTGRYYSGVDDFTLIYPKFKTSYSYYSKTGAQETKMEGRFEEALLTIHPFRVQKDIYSLEADKYSSYLFGNQGITHVVNKDNPNGIKVLFVKDSFTVPLAAFLSTVCSDVYLVDPRYYKGDIPKYVNSLNLDYVFISFDTENLTEEFFDFYQQDKK